MSDFNENLSESIAKRPLISVLIPVYNTEPFLRDCLNSVINQTYTNFEVILVDDGSTDQSGAICDEYALKDNRFKVIHQENQGVAIARIVGFDNSRGEFISFIDSDDYVSPDFLEQLSKPIINEGADIVCCDMYRIINQTKVQWGKIVSGVFRGESLRDFISNRFLFNKQTKNYGIHPGLTTKMVRRSLVKDALLLGKGLRNCEDSIGVLQMLTRCQCFVVLPSKLYNYVKHDGEVVIRYDRRNWEDIIEYLQRIVYLCDREGITINVIRSGTWKYISNTMYKMRMANLNCNSFCKDLSFARNTSYMKRYFEPWLINKQYGIKGNVGYILLKLKWYRVLWMISMIKD